MDEETKEKTPVHALSPSQDPAPPRTKPQAEAHDTLEEIFEQHHRRVLNAAFRITGNGTDAEDVLQTVFLRLARRKKPPGPADELGPYLHRAAVNAALDLIRSRKRARAVPLEEVDDRPPEASGGGGPESRSQHREVLAKLRQTLSTLSPRAAEIFSLRFIEGYGNKEIAHMLGTSQTAIGVALHRVRGQLQSALGDLGGQLT